MTWFAAGLPLLLQLLVPAVLLGAVALDPRPTRARSTLIAFAACYLIAIGVTGLWLVLPWWMPWLYGGLLLAAAVRTTRPRIAAPTPTASWPSRLLVGVSVLGALGAATVAATGLLGRRPPSSTVDLAFPFARGTYLVANGGMSPLINAHLVALQGEPFLPYRGQSYGVDLVKVDRFGLRARGLFPRDPAAYAIYGEPVVAPCAGRVVAAVDGVPDMHPPETDRSHMAGNHLLIACGPAWVLLGHLRRGSAAVRAGEHVRVGQHVGRAGNSGNTGEPHLHIHAQQPGTAVAPLGGEPRAIRLGGRFLARNDRVTVE